MPFFEHDAIRFHYELAGEGPLLVFCHGLTGNLEQVRELIGSISGIRQLFWDARGHGQTTPAGPAEGFAFDAFARDLEALLDHLAIERAVIGGVSMGAAVSTRFAIRNPDRVGGLILVRPAWLTEPLPEGLRLFPTVAGYLERLEANEGCRLLEDSADFQALREQSPDAASGLRDQFFQEDGRERRERLRGIPGDAPIRNWSEVENLRIPALVIGNEPDYVHPLSYAKAWAERLPLGRFELVPAKAAGFEPYAQAVSQHVKAFLNSLEGSQ